MKFKLLGILLLAGSSIFAGTRFYVGVGAGGGYYPGYYAAPPPPPAVAYYPPAPASNYAWVGGYYYPVGPRWVYRSGYWAPRPYYGASWIGPHWYGGRYYRGYWRR